MHQRLKAQKIFMDLCPFESVTILQTNENVFDFAGSIWRALTNGKF